MQTSSASFHANKLLPCTLHTVAIKMAKEQDPGLQRTLGVLTKPDTIESGCHHIWISVMNGSSFPLKLVSFNLNSSFVLQVSPQACPLQHRLFQGYFMVRNSNKIELTKRISHEVWVMKGLSYLYAQEL